MSLDRELIEAAARGDVERVEEFLIEGGDVNARDELGSTLLHAAAAWGRFRLVKLLIDRGADVNAKTCSTALRCTSWLGLLAGCPREIT